MVSFNCLPSVGISARSGFASACQHVSKGSRMLTSCRRRRADMLIFPKLMRVAHLAQGLADLQHGRVRGQHVECLAWRGRGEGRIYGFLAVGDEGAYGELG